MEKNEIEMKGDNELSIGRNIGQGHAKAMRESWRERKFFSSFSTTAPFLDQARPCFRNASPYYLRAWQGVISRCYLDHLTVGPLEGHHCLLTVTTPVSSKGGHKTKKTCSKRVPNIIVSPLLFSQVVALFAFFLKLKSVHTSH